MSLLHSYVRLLLSTPALAQQQRLAPRPEASLANASAKAQETTASGPCVVSASRVSPSKARPRSVCSPGAVRPPTSRKYFLHALI